MKYLTLSRPLFKRKVLNTYTVNIKLKIIYDSLRVRSKKRTNRSPSFLRLLTIWAVKGSFTAIIITLSAR
jgi:hypothetical protein